MKLLDVRHPFFLPMSRRVATCAATGGWGVFEYSTGNTGWAVIFAMIALYCAFEFFVIFDPENYRRDP